MYSAKMGRNFVSLQNSFVRNNKVLFHAYSERTRTFPRISNSISTDFFFILYITHSLLSSNKLQRLPRFKNLSELKIL